MKKDKHQVVKVISKSFPENKLQTCLLNMKKTIHSKEAIIETEYDKDHTFGVALLIYGVGNGCSEPPLELMYCEN